MTACSGWDSAARAGSPSPSTVRSARWRPRPPHFPGKAKRVIHLFMNGGPSHVDTFDPKPMLAKYARQAAAEPEPAAPSARPARPCARRSSSSKYGQSGIEVSELFAHDGRAHRRHLRHPLDARRRAQPRAVADADELRRRPAGAAEHGLVGHLRPGHREPEPARLRRDVPRRLADRGDAELAVGVPAGRLPGHVHRHPAHRRRQADREHPQRRDRRRPSSGGSSTCCAELNERHLRAARRTTPSSRRGSSRSSWPTGCRRRPRDAFDVSREPRVDPRRCTAPATQARQLLIARRLVERGVRFVQVWHGDGPAVGRPRRPRGAATASSPGSATRPIAALLDRPEAARAARRDAGHLGRRVRPDAGRRAADGNSAAAATTTTTASRCGWPAAASRAATSTARPTSSASQAVEDTVHVHDLHATILHLLGFDHETAHLPLRRPRLPPDRRPRPRRQGARGLSAISSCVLFVDIGSCYNSIDEGTADVAPAVLPSQCSSPGGFDVTTCRGHLRDTR